jgi:TolA-binding protein
MATMENETQTEERPPEHQPTDVQQLTNAIKAQVKKWLPSVLVVAAVLIATTTYRAHKTHSAEAASVMFGGVKNAQQFQDIVNQYPGTGPAQLAMLGLAKSQYDNGDFVLANSTYTDFEKKYPKHPMVSIAQVGRIHCLEAMGQTAEALAGFTAFASNHVDHFLTPLALLGEGRCLERMRRYDEAKAVYEDFLAAHPKSDWRDDMDEALTMLKRDMRKPSVKL